MRGERDRQKENEVSLKALLFILQVHASQDPDQTWFFQERVRSYKGTCEMISLWVVYYVAL